MQEKYFYKKQKEVPLYRGWLVVIITNDQDKLQRQIPKIAVQELYAHTWFTPNWDGRRGFVIILNFHNSFRKVHNGTISHEALHAAHFIADSVGIDANFDNDEPITYLIEWIVDEVYELMHKHNLQAVI